MTQRSVDHLIIHCSATKADQNITATDIDKWHRAKGWWGCGYHYVITRDGRIQSHENGDRCRPLAQSGSHVGECGPGWNARSIGLCMVGGVGRTGKAENNFTEAQWNALEIAVLEILAKFPTIKHLGGHRDLIKKTGASPKDCPCFDAFDWFDKNVKANYPDALYVRDVGPI